jgi:hypothetical protein
MANGYDALSARAVAAAPKRVAESALLPQRRPRDSAGPAIEASSGDLPPWLRKSEKQQESPSDWDYYGEEERGTGAKIEIEIELPACPCMTTGAVSAW